MKQQRVFLIHSFIHSFRSSFRSSFIHSLTDLQTWLTRNWRCHERTIESNFNVSAKKCILHGASYFDWNTVQWHIKCFCSSVCLVVGICLQSPYSNIAPYTAVQIWSEFKLVNTCYFPMRLQNVFLFWSETTIMITWCTRAMCI